MPNKKYARAAAQENRVKHEWIRKGYVAARSAGSHSAYDVYAVKPTGPATKETKIVRGIEYVQYVTPIIGFAVQCKRRTL